MSNQESLRGRVTRRVAASFLAVLTVFAVPPKSPSLPQEIPPLPPPVSETGPPPFQKIVFIQPPKTNGKIQTSVTVEYPFPLTYPILSSFFLLPNGQFPPEIEHDPSYKEIYMQARQEKQMVEKLFPEKKVHIEMTTATDQKDRVYAAYVLRGASTIFIPTPQGLQEIALDQHTDAKAGFYVDEKREVQSTIFFLIYKGTETVIKGHFDTTTGAILPLTNFFIHFPQNIEGAIIVYSTNTIP